jgi:integrase/recombinase XerD
LSNLKAKDIHLDFLEVRKGKGEKDRTVPLTATLAVRLQNFINENKIPPDEKIFSLKPASISNKIRQFADKAGINDLHTHTLRHKFANNLVEKGISLRIVQDLLGHDNLNTTQVYLSVTDKNKREAIKSLDEQPELDSKSDPNNSGSSGSSKRESGGHL